MQQQGRVRAIRGVISHDPLRGAPAGTTLRVEPSLFIGRPDDDALASIGNWDFFEGVVVALHFGSARGQHILGTGVLVAPGVVLAARHVIEPHQDNLMAGRVEIICTGISLTGVMVWTCHQVTLIDKGDLALLMVRAASDLPPILRLATLTTRLPRLDENIVITGIRHHATDPVNIGDELQLSMMAARGKVTARYEHGRDRVILPSPCFEVDCPAIGGMSGGAAFDEEGFVIGTVTSSFENGPTYLSLIWPAMVARISPMWPDGLYTAPSSLLAMDRRICGIHRPEAIQISNDSSIARSE